jgi:hypothetical protein
MKRGTEITVIAERVKKQKNMGERRNASRLSAFDAFFSVRTLMGPRRNGQNVAFRENFTMQTKTAVKVATFDAANGASGEERGEKRRTRKET